MVELFHFRRVILLIVSFWCLNPNGVPWSNGVLCHLCEQWVSKEYQRYILEACHRNPIFYHGGHLSVSSYCKSWCICTESRDNKVVYWWINCATIDLMDRQLNSFENPTNSKDLYSFGMELVNSSQRMTWNQEEPIITRSHFTIEIDKLGSLF